MYWSTSLTSFLYDWIPHRADVSCRLEPSATCSLPTSVVLWKTGLDISTRTAFVGLRLQFLVDLDFSDSTCIFDQFSLHAADTCRPTLYLHKNVRLTFDSLTQHLQLFFNLAIKTQHWIELQLNTWHRYLFHFWSIFIISIISSTKLPFNHLSNVQCKSKLAVIIAKWRATSECVEFNFCGR